MGTTLLQPEAAPRRRDWTAVGGRIIDAACALFEQGGPDAVTMAAVARASGVNRTTVHRHHGTRDDLLWAVSDRLVARLDVALAEGLHPASLQAGVEAVVDRLVSDPDRARQTLRSLLGPEPSASALDLLATEVAMMRLLAGGPLGRPGIDPEVLAVINLAGVLLWSALADRGLVVGGSERYRAEVMRLMLHGAVDPDAVPSGGHRGQ